MDGVWVSGRGSLRWLSVRWPFVPLKVVGAESAFDCGTMPCDAFEADPSDQPSLQRGAPFMQLLHGVSFAAVFADTTAWPAIWGIPEDLYKANLVFDPKSSLAR